MNRLTATATTRGTKAVIISTDSGRLELDYADTEGRNKPCPVELVISGLAGCVALTIRSVAEAKNYPLRDIRVDVVTEADYERPPKAGHRIDITLAGDLTEKEKTILFRSAKACHVHKLLGGDNTFTFNLATTAPGE